MFTKIDDCLFKIRVFFVGDFSVFVIQPYIEHPMLIDQITKQIGEFAITFFHDFINMFMVVTIILDQIIDGNNFNKLSDSFIKITKAKHIIHKMTNMANRILSLASKRKGDEITNSSRTMYFNTYR